MLRRWAPSWRVYAVNTLDVQRSYLVARPPPACPRAPFAWVPFCWALQHEEVKRTVGLDEYVFLRFIRMAFKWLSLAAFLSLVIIVPINATAQQSGEGSNLDPKLISGIGQLTMATIRNRSSLLWAHLVVYVACSCWLMALLWDFWREFEVYSGEFFTSQTAAAEQHAVLVTNVPLRHLTSAERMERRPKVERGVKSFRQGVGVALRRTAEFFEARGLDRSGAHTHAEALDPEVTDFGTELASDAVCEPATPGALGSCLSDLPQGGAGPMDEIEAAGGAEEDGSETAPPPINLVNGGADGVAAGSAAAAELAEADERAERSGRLCPIICEGASVIWRGMAAAVRWAWRGVFTGVGQIVALLVSSSRFLYRFLWSAIFECVPFDAVPMALNYGDSARAKRRQAAMGLIHETTDSYADVSSRVHGLFSQLWPHDYEACWCVPDTRRLDGLAATRTQTLRTLATAQHTLLKGQRQMHRSDGPRSGVRPRELGFPDLSMRPSERATGAEEEATNEEISEGHSSAPRAALANAGGDVELGAVPRPGEAGGYAPPVVAMDKSAASAAGADATSSRSASGAMGELTDVARGGLEHCRQCGCDCMVLCCSCVCHCCSDVAGARRRQVNLLLRRLDEIDRALESECSEVLQRWPTSSAIVIFRSRRAAAAAAQMLVAQGPAWRVTPCPGATDLQWKNLVIDEKTRFLRSGRAALWGAAMIVCFTPLVSFLQDLFTCDRLGWMCAWGQFFTNFVNGTLPQMIQSIFLILGHMAALLAARFSGDVSLAAQNRRASWTYWALIVINLWLVVLVTRVGNIWDVGAWFSNLGNVWESLGLLIPITSTYFLNYTVFRTFSALAMETISLPLLLQYWARMGIARVRDGATLKAEMDHQAGPIPFPFHRVVAQVTFVFALACIYLVIAPVVAGFAWVFFLLATPVWRYNCIFKYQQTSASGGRIWATIFGQVMAGMLTAQVTLSCVFFVKQAWVVGGFSIALIVFTIGFWVVALERFARATRSLPLRLNADALRRDPQRVASGLSEQRVPRSIDGALIEAKDIFAPPRLAQAITGERPSMLSGPASMAPSASRDATERVRRRLAQVGIYRDRARRPSPSPS